MRRTMRRTNRTVSKVATKTGGKARRNRTPGYNKVAKHIYSFKLKSGKLTYRVTRMIKGKTLTATFNTLRDCRLWLKTFATR